MSKGGGAGKVYFVLYLAVVLELLIIIVERDEAEESLHKKQKETMRIVESILSQLQAGSGSEGINTRPQDEITLPPPGINMKEVFGTEIKSFRKYIVEVGVTDVSASIKKKEDESEKEYLQRMQTLVKLANVAELEYQVFYNESQDPSEPPTFLSPDEIDDLKIDFVEIEPGDIIENDMGDVWEFLGVRKLVLDDEATFNKLDLNKVSLEAIEPVYPSEKVIHKGPGFSPKDINPDSTFYYSHAESLKNTKIADAGMQKRSFIVYFQPPDKAGWYKLRFSSRTNKILGLRKEASQEEYIDDETTVNIGTVQLTVKSLEQVRKSLESTLEKFDLPAQVVMLEEDGLEKFNRQMSEARQRILNEDEAVDLMNKFSLYSYIAKLLTPGMSRYFDQNKGKIEFNIRVTKPTPQTVDPIIAVANEIHRFDAIQPQFRISIAPFREGQNQLQGLVYNASEGTTSEPIARVEFIEAGESVDVEGKGKDFFARIDQILSAAQSGGPRKYLVKLVHSLQGKVADTTAELTIYPAMVEDEVTKLANLFEARAAYGNYFIFNYIPPSGNKILPEQFCYKFVTDGDPQPRGCERGYSADRDDNLFFGVNSKKASLEIVWKDPISDQEVPIFPKKEVSIRQNEPKILVNQASENIGGSQDRIKVRIVNIKIKPPDIGVQDDSKTAKIDVEVDVEKVRVSKNYKLAGKPSFTIKDEVMTIEFDLVGEPDEEGWAKGSVDVSIVAYATNPVNGVRSTIPARKTLPISIRKKFDLFQNDFMNPYR